MDKLINMCNFQVNEREKKRSNYMYKNFDPRNSEIKVRDYELVCII